MSRSYANAKILIFYTTAKYKFKVSKISKRTVQLNFCIFILTRSTLSASYRVSDAMLYFPQEPSALKIIHWQFEFEV